MPVVTTTITTLAAPWTTAQLVTTLRQAMTTAGFTTLYDEFVTGSSNYTIYQQILNPTATKGTLYLRNEVFNSTSSANLTCVIYDNWNEVPNTGANPSYTTTSSFSTTSPLTLRTFAHPELRGVLVSGATGTGYFMGYARPATKVAWWDENQHLFCFRYDFTHLSYGPSGTSSPYKLSSTDNTFNFVTYPTLINPNNVTQKRDLVPGILLSTPTTIKQGNVGRFSDDLALYAANGTLRFDTLQVTANTEEYLVLHVPSDGCSGVAIRTI